MIASKSEDKKDILNNTVTFFGPETPLKNSEKYGATKYELRQQQNIMALKIAEAFEKKENLCVEAPTGIGKSYAYLVPAVFLAKKAKKPVLISTETINLQEQLINKDIPILKKMVENSFNAALAKGRSHYLCLRRMYFTLEKTKEKLFEDYVNNGIKNIHQWISSGGSGDKSDIDFPLESNTWALLCCEAGNCSGPKCSFYKDCLYWRQRKSWDNADIVVCNHALFFTGIKVEDLFGFSLLPKTCAIVFDEAHTIENEAAEHCGLHITKLGFESLLKKLYDPQKTKGLLLTGGDCYPKARGLISQIFDLSSAYFKQIYKFLAQNDEPVRFISTGFAKDILSEELINLANLINNATEKEKNENSSQELKAYSIKIETFANAFYEFSNMKLNDHVYWAEKDEKNGDIHIYATPLNIKELLNKKIFNKEKSIILTSATLSLKNSLDYFCDRVGFDGGEKTIMNAVFNYESQMKIYIPKNTVPPEHKNYINTLCYNIKKYVEQTHGKAFVLFTNFKNLKTCAENLRDFFQEKNITLLVHGEQLSRSKMLEQFKKDTNSVIFGATSFWSGVDVPGESLSNVIITKLPFLVPSHPLVQARSEKIQKQGKNYFADYQIPEAILRFKQGIGRLIRTKNDKGIVVILDSRILTKTYGKSFLESIPKCEIIEE